MTASGTKPTLAGYQDQVRLPAHSRPSGLKGGSPTHIGRSAGMRRRSVHDPLPTFGGCVLLPTFKPFQQRLEPRNAGADSLWIDSFFGIGGLERAIRLDQILQGRQALRGVGGRGGAPQGQLRIGGGSTSFALVRSEKARYGCESRYTLKYNTKDYLHQ